ncbi:unnamed protein product [Kuraishia capsulata CBS 1993]|uniref:Uncharacterized protein n=1 Tax=Kuraishia capsulata CBS 1993 TaxID=1382522 RepID=W6MRT9_9ASCO|nr:uncharacterized protein KUCA_T00005474001 [Kuraishia capsulata CBS 1993]CDK29486.1 unnamed protein product [Kuraishia capsulata CBS 1993]
MYKRKHSQIMVPEVWPLPTQVSSVVVLLGVVVGVFLLEVFAVALMEGVSTYFRDSWMKLDFSLRNYFTVDYMGYFELCSQTIVKFMPVSIPIPPGLFEPAIGFGLGLAFCYSRNHQVPSPLCVQCSDEWVQPDIELRPFKLLSDRKIYKNVGDG